MTNKDLKRWYRRYNRKHFQNKLPDISVRFADMERSILGDTVFWGNEVAYVQIDRRIKNWTRVVKMVLLHEMCHVSLPMKIMHGPRFEARMRSLSARRAFSGLW